jgi:catechol 2,3-dioxygenase-like lactoylglutathione lyase family enzyme
MIDYVTVGTNDWPRAQRFYDAVLATLGYARDYEDDQYIGWTPGGAAGLPGFVIAKPFNGKPATAGNGVMVAFGAATATQVHAFYDTALAQGGADEGAPGIRPHYGPDFYVAYVRDLDGNKLACVCRTP